MPTLPARRRQARDDVAQQGEARGALEGGVGVGEQRADVAHAGGAQQRVDHGMRGDVGVGVAGEAPVVRRSRARRARGGDRSANR